MAPTETVAVGVTTAWLRRVVKLRIAIEEVWRSAEAACFPDAPLLCPSPAVCPETPNPLRIAVGLRVGPSSYPHVISFATHERDPSAILEAIGGVSVERASFYENGLLPTHLSMSGPSSGNLIFTGFQEQSRGFKMVSGSVDFQNWTATSKPKQLCPLEGDLFRAGATLDPGHGYLLAAGRSWHDRQGARHPVTSICRLTNSGSLSTLLEPRQGEFALVRPTLLSTPAADLMFFSTRTDPSTYGSGAAILSESTWVRIPVSFRIDSDPGFVPTYFFPFYVQGHLWAVYSLSYDGVGGVALAKCHFSWGGAVA